MTKCTQDSRQNISDRSYTASNCQAATTPPRLWYT